MPAKYEFLFRFVQKLFLSAIVLLVIYGNGAMLFNHLPLKQKLPIPEITRLFTLSLALTNTSIKSTWYGVSLKTNNGFVWIWTNLFQINEEINTRACTRGCIDL